MEYSEYGMHRHVFRFSGRTEPSP